GGEVRSVSVLLTATDETAAERLGLPTSPAGLEKASLAWAPWRAYAVQHLWATGAHPVNSLPESPEPQETIA
ncbi:MAG: hypothetical protein J0I40_09590, partial [Cellulomonas sp.]|nr:hypothetical protein [Cellulomonas sp.]